MSGTEFNYVVNVDTSRLMSAMSEVRSQMGMALNSGGGGAGGDVSGGVGSAFNRMMSGFNSGSMFGGTYTSDAMAYSPHYGMIQAQSSLQNEWLVNRYGTPAAQLMKPPGMGAYEFAMGMQSNFTDRRIEAEHSAFAGARSAFVGGAAGLGAGELASAAGSMLGARLGASLGTKLGIGAGMGSMLGGLAGGWFAFDAASEVVGGAVQKHYAEIEQIGGVTRELGEIAGSGQGWGRERRYEMGRAARLAAKDIGMDVQEMGDLMAGARSMGMMPNASDPGKMRTQLAEFGRAIEEGAQALHTSVGNAMSVIKGMGGMGFGAREGVSHLIGMAGAAGISPMQMYGVGMQGASMANSNLLGGRQGFDLFTSSVVGAAGSGLGREELSMAGGVVGLGRTVAMTQMGAALGPMGDMQLMAAMGGGLPGGIFDMGSAAIGSMAQGGDMIGNVMHFQTHKRELLRGQGAMGIRAMANAQIGGITDLLQDLAPSASREDVERFALQNVYGLNEVQAKGMYGSLHGGGGGGGGGGASAASMEAYQNVSLSRVTGMGSRPDRAMVGTGAGMNFDTMKYGAVLGATVGGIWGGVIGGAAGLAYDAATKIDWGMMTEGPGLFASAEAKADFEYSRMAKRYDSEMASAKQRYGEIPIDPYMASRISGAKLERVQLDVDGLGGPASQHLGNILAMGGIKPTGIGPGTVKVGGQGFNIQEVRKEAKMWDSHAIVNREVEGAVVNAVNTKFTSEIGAARSTFRSAYERFAAGPILERMETTGFLGDIIDRRVVDERANTLADLKHSADVLIAPSAGVVVGKDSQGRNITLGQEYAQHGLAGAHVRGFLGRATGGDLPEVNAEARTNLSLQGAAAMNERQREGRMSQWMFENYAMDTLREGGLSRNLSRAAPTALMVSALSRDSNFQAALAAGDMSQVEKVMLDMAPDYAGAPVAAIISSMKSKKVSPLGKDDPVGVGLAATFGMAAAIDSVANTHIVDNLRQSKTIKEAMDPVSFLHEAGKFIAEKLDLNAKPKAKRKRSRPGMMENAVGFGDQESAMSTINKSLKESNRQQKQTARILDTIEKRLPMPKTGAGES